MTKKCIFALRDQLCEIIDFNSTSNDFEIEQKVKRFFSENSLQQDTRYLNYFRNTHETVLMYACRNNKANIVKLLIEAGADLNVQDHCKRTALFYVISSGSYDLTRAEVENNREIISTIVDAIGRDKWDTRNGTGYDALLWAIKIGYLPTVKLLIEKGFEINSTKKKRTHALTQAVSEKTPNVDVVNYLITIGANVNECDEYGWTPLMCVFKPEVARILIENGADLNFKDIHGRTALMVNTYNQDTYNVLLDSGANIYLHDLNGKTALEHISQPFNNNKFRRTDRGIDYLTKRYLEQLFTYFYEFSSTQIRANIQKYIEAENNEHFPVKPYHIYALNLFFKKLAEYYLDDNVEILESYLLNFPIVLYFLSMDFQEKIWADVLNRLDENNLELNGELVIGRRARAKGQQSVLDKIANLLKRVQKDRQVAEDFYELVNKMTPELLRLANKLFSTNLVNNCCDEFDKALSNQLNKHWHTQMISY